MYGLRTEVSVWVVPTEVLGTWSDSWSWSPEVASAAPVGTSSSATASVTAVGVFVPLFWPAAVGGVAVCAAAGAAVGLAAAVGGGSCWVSSRRGRGCCGCGGCICGRSLEQRASGGILITKIPSSRGHSDCKECCECHKRPHASANTSRRQGNEGSGAGDSFHTKSLPKSPTTHIHPRGQQTLTRLMHC